MRALPNGSAVESKATFSTELAKRATTEGEESAEATARHNSICLDAYVAKLSESSTWDASREMGNHLAFSNQTLLLIHTSIY